MFWVSGRQLGPLLGSEYTNVRKRRQLQGAVDSFHGDGGPIAATLSEVLEEPSPRFDQTSATIAE
jgi:hypothetical protein